MPMNTPTAARTVWPVRMADTVAAGTVRTARVAAFSANRTAVGRRWARWSKTVDMRLLNEGGRRGRAAKLTGRTAVVGSHRLTTGTGKATPYTAGRRSAARTNLTGRDGLAAQGVAVLAG